MKKYLAEMFGTMTLVLMGCGSAVFIGGCGTPAQVIVVACCFGLSVVAMAYAIGGISGGHVNPAITLGVFLSGRMSGKDAGFYMLFQVIGALLGSAILCLLVNNIDPAFQTTFWSSIGGKSMQTSVVVHQFATTTGANALQPGVSVAGGFIAEMVFTAIFVLVALGATDKKYGCGNMAGLAIGLSLVLVHLVCIPITGTSVNPARSIGPALFQGGVALQQLWIFIVAPLLGSFIAAGIWKIVDDARSKNEAAA